MKRKSLLQRLNSFYRGATVFFGLCTVALVIGKLAHRFLTSSTFPTALEVAEDFGADLAPMVINLVDSMPSNGGGPLTILPPAVAVPKNRLIDSHTDQRLYAKRLEVAIRAAQAELQYASASEAQLLHIRLDSLKALRLPVEHEQR